MKKFVQFISLIIFMMLLNLVAHLIGVLFIDKYVEHERDFLFGEMLFFFCIYSFFQIFVFPINKKYRIYIIPAFTLLLASLMLFRDTGGYGGEVLYLTTTLVSKILTFFLLIGYEITDDKIRFIFMDLLFSVGYSLYLLGVFSSFKYIMKCLGRKYDLFAINNVVKSRKVKQ
ncbi:MAG: hypothetical protein FWH36_03260 [Lentimicrobiaceae bacterium]|nr:hypothetical protein [Lentimicrobiaceae bacterium]